MTIIGEGALTVGGGLLLFKGMGILATAAAGAAAKAGVIATAVIAEEAAKSWDFDLDEMPRVSDKPPRYEDVELKEALPHSTSTKPYSAIGAQKHLQSQGIQKVSATLKFESYLESWSQVDGRKIDPMDVVKTMNIEDNTVIDVAFGDFTFTQDGQGYVTIGGLQISMAEFSDIVNYVQSKGGKVKISLGGATYPLSTHIKDPDLIQNIARVITQNHLDGVDLDIEDHPSTADMTAFIKSLRQAIGADKIITLTLPGAYWTAGPLVQAVMDDVTAFSFMEYFIPMNQDTYVDSIKWDINYYMTNWNLPAEKIQLGLMPGNAGGNTLTLEDATELAQWAEDKGFYGVMIWSLTRDYSGETGAAPLAYSKAIEGILDRSMPWTPIGPGNPMEPLTPAMAKLTPAQFRPQPLTPAMAPLHPAMQPIGPADPMEPLTPAKKPGGKQIVGYWESWQGWSQGQKLTDMSDKYTAMNIAFAMTQGGTGLNTSTICLDGLEDQIGVLQARGEKVAISVGGATDAFAIGPDTTALAKSIVDFVEEYNLDGVDLDDEHIALNGANGQANFINLIHNIRKELNERFPGIHKTLTYTAYPNGVTADPSAPYTPGNNFNEAVEIIKKTIDDLDFVQPMSYNYGGGSATIPTQVLAEFAQVTPKEKLVLGLMPGRDDEGVDTPLKGGAGSAEVSLQYIKEQGYAGVMFWDANRDLAGQDGNGPNAFVDEAAAILV